MSFQGWKTDFHRSVCNLGNVPFDNAVIFLAPIIFAQHLLNAGSSKPVVKSEVGDIVVVHVLAVNDTKKVVVDTVKRGLPLRFQLTQTPKESWEVLALGLEPGQQKTGEIEVSEVKPVKLTVSVKLIAIIKKQVGAIIDRRT